MALPKMNVPRYTVELPSTGAKLNMRPYLVKEEKVLMIALESNDPEQITQAVRNIIKSCYELDTLDNLTVFDIEMLFLQLRAKSVGEEMNIQIKCKTEECGTMNPISVNIDDVVISKPEKEMSDTIILDKKQGVGIKMKYPSVDTIGRINPEKFNSVEGIMDLIIECIDSIFDDDNVFDAKNETKEDLEEFIESLSSEQFKLVQAFFQDTPAVSYYTEFTCNKCKTVNEVELKGLNSFFS
jgi:hypothetical protein